LNRGEVEYYRLDIGKERSFPHFHFSIFFLGKGCASQKKKKETNSPEKFHEFI